MVEDAVCFCQKENSFSLGEYPIVSLAGARKKRDGIRKQLAEGLDPSVVRKSEKARESGDGSFEMVAREWHKRFAPSKWSPGHAETILHRLEQDVFPYIGRRPIEKITAPDRIESRFAIRPALRANPCVIID